MRKLTTTALLVSFACLIAACGGDDDDAASTPQGFDQQIAQEIIDNYTAVVYANYAETESTAKNLQSAVNTFIDSPSEENLKKAREAWIAAREPYTQTEVYRFYGGPIDDEKTGVEGELNAWPLDENYVDYVLADDGSRIEGGIINDLQTYPEVTKEVIRTANEKVDEKSISTGYHTIEFLLWGQDKSVDGPGDRPFSDYIDGGLATAPNADRRGTYLKLATEILVEDINVVLPQWESGKDNYAASFKKLDQKEALRRILTGMGALSKAELRGERMLVPFDNKDQEDEQSCFSDNTLADFLYDEVAIQNVYLGRYGSIDGKGIEDLVKPLNAELDTKMKAQMQAVIDAINSIPAPFDQAILGDDSSEGRQKIQAALDALDAQSDTIVEIAELLNVSINIAEEGEE